MRARPASFLSALALVCLTATAAGQLPAMRTEVVATGLVNPIFAGSPPGDPRLFIVEQPGTIRILTSGKLQAEPFLDLTAGVQFFGEAGLLGLAFDPDYVESGVFYVFYNNLAGDTVLARYTATPPSAATADPASAEVLLVIDKVFDKHNGGMLAFGPDGMLYLSTGDGGGTHDPFGSAQRLDTLLGKILRLDVSGGTTYAVPADNPFVGVVGAREEIYALGLRNPWRFGLDPVTGSLFVGDVGAFEREELDHVPPGGGVNFGWDCEEGTQCSFEGGCNPCPDLGFELPIHEYDHNVGCAILGGPVYHGAALPALDGRAFFADYCVGRIWSLAFDGTTASDVVDHTAELRPPEGFGLLTSFGQDDEGELYLTSFFPGVVRKIVAAGVDADCDQDGLPDADELAQGLAFDVNENAIPDSCELLLEGTDFVTGQHASLTFIGAQPADPVAMLWSTRGIGEGPCFYGGAWCLTLLPMSNPAVPIGVLGVAFAKADGSVTTSFVVPDFTAPKPVAMQAVVIKFESSLVSNPIQKVIL
jgi:glucose/arabinose dehydrogenase